MNIRFLDACRGQNSYNTPIWLMRQAGRYMAAYRKLREKHGLLEMVKTPELACEVTLQPIDAFGMDAAIIFSDILPILEGMGLKLTFLQGEGPHIENPIRTSADIDALRTPPAEESLWFTLDAIKLARKELDTRGIPLIGFSGAPFTLASYAIEGGGSREYRLTKQMMYGEPHAWHLLMEKLSAVIGNYMCAQVRAGAQALQLFDSWAGALSPSDYATYVMPYVRKVIAHAKTTDVPVIYFSTGTSGYLPLLAELGADVVSVDWRIDLDVAWRALGTRSAIQGNLDPMALLAPWPELEKCALRLLEQASRVHANRAGFIFNLGHGILQQTPEDNVKRLVDLVATSAEAVPRR